MDKPENGFSALIIAGGLRYTARSSVNIPTEDRRHLALVFVIASRRRLPIFKIVGFAHCFSLSRLFAPKHLTSLQFVQSPKRRIRQIQRSSAYRNQFEHKNQYSAARLSNSISLS